MFRWVICAFRAIFYSLLECSAPNKQKLGWNLTTSCRQLRNFCCWPRGKKKRNKKGSCIIGSQMDNATEWLVALLYGDSLMSCHPLQNMPQGKILNFGTLLWWYQVRIVFLCPFCGDIKGGWTSLCSFFLCLVPSSVLFSLLSLFWVRGLHYSLRLSVPSVSLLHVGIAGLLGEIAGSANAFACTYSLFHQLGLIPGPQSKEE